MLDDDAKKIMYSKFDKDTNFQNIIKNVNQKKRKKIYIRLFQYALVPSCTILIICVLMLKNNNVANLLVGKRNTTLLNTMVKDNSIMDIEMNKMIENLENKIPTEISDKKEIYRTINSGEAIMSDDPTIPDNLINNHSKSNYVVKVKIISIGEGEMLPKQENFYNPHTCYTPIKIQITDNLMDTNKLSGIINAYINGGKIKISNLLKTINNEEARTGLWNFISAHFSMIDKVEGNTYTDEKLSFLLEDSSIKETISPYFMARIVDFVGFMKEYRFKKSHNENRTWKFVLTDPMLEENQGTFCINIDKDGKANVEKINETCNDEISIQTMTTMLMGYKRPEYLYKIGRIKTDKKIVEMLENSVKQDVPYISDYF